MANRRTRRHRRLKSSTVRQRGEEGHRGTFQRSPEPRTALLPPEGLAIRGERNCGDATLAPPSVSTQLCPYWVDARQDPNHLATVRFGARPTSGSRGRRVTTSERGSLVTSS